MSISPQFLKKALSTVCLLSIFNVQVAFAVDDDADVELTRGQAVEKLVEYYDLENRNASYIEQCLQVPDECFFVFSAQSDFDGISFDPLKLYPDVSEGNRYAHAIEIATMLGLVHGHVNEQQTPFHPNYYLSRIQALKIVLAATKQLPWKDKFEIEGDHWTTQSLLEQYRFDDIDPVNTDEWWYGRYTAFALDAGIIDDTNSFRPNAPITESEMMDMMERAKPIMITPQDTDAITVPEIQQPVSESQQTNN